MTRPQDNRLLPRLSTRDLGQIEDNKTRSIPVMWRGLGTSSKLDEMDHLLRAQIRGRKHDCEKQ